MKKPSEYFGSSLQLIALSKHRVSMSLFESFSNFTVINLTKYLMINKRVLQLLNNFFYDQIRQIFRIKIICVLFKY